MEGAKELTWSHASFITANIKRVAAATLLRRNDESKKLNVEFKRKN